MPTSVLFPIRSPAAPATRGRTAAAWLMLAAVLPGCANLFGESGPVAPPSSAARFACADGAEVAVQTLPSPVPEVESRLPPVELYFGTARSIMRPVGSGPTGVRYAAARSGWEWFGHEEMVLRDAGTNQLLARGCRPVSGTAASPAPGR